MPGVDGVAQDFLQNLDQAVLLSPLLRNLQLEDIPQLLGFLIFD